MDLVQAVNQRKSIRAFTPQAVPQSVLKDIMTLSLRAPSWANTQPWEFAIATGKKLAEIRRRYVAKTGEAPVPDIPLVDYFPEPYNTRMHNAVAKSHAAKGIQRENKQQRQEWEILQLSNMGAPCEIYVCLDRSFYLQDGRTNVWPIYDCGAIVGMITLLAANYGLGTIIQARAVVYPDIIRDVLGLTQSKLMLVGVAIGYPDWQDPLNQYSSDREPPDKLISWHGFES